MNEKWERLAPLFDLPHVHTHEEQHAQGEEHWCQDIEGIWTGTAAAEDMDRLQPCEPIPYYPMPDGTLEQDARRWRMQQWCGRRYGIWHFDAEKLDELMMLHPEWEESPH